MVSPSSSRAGRAGTDSSHWLGAGPPQLTRSTKGYRSCERTCLRKPPWYAIVCEHPAVSRCRSTVLEMADVGTPGEAEPPHRAFRDALVPIAVCIRPHGDGLDNRPNQFQGATVANSPANPWTPYGSLRRRRCWHVGLESSACPRNVRSDRPTGRIHLGSAHSHTLQHCYLQISAVIDTGMLVESIG